MKAAADFEQLVEAHYAALYRFALSLSHSEIEAADLTQQTFYLWAAKGHQLRDAQQAKAWLFTTLYREFLRGRKEQERMPQAELDDTTEQPSEESAPPVEGIEPSAVIEALRQLDAAYRAPVTLFYLQDFSYRQIADVLGVPIGTVMSRISRGKAELKRRLLDRERALHERVVSPSSTNFGAHAND